MHLVLLYVLLNRAVRWRRHNILSAALEDIHQYVYM
jgi:hypothetical protein